MPDKTTKSDQLRAMREAKFSGATNRRSNRLAAAKEALASATAKVATDDAEQNSEDDVAKSKTKSKAKAGAKKKAKTAKPHRTAKAKTAKPRKAKTAAAKTSTRTNGHGSKLGGIKELLTRPGGCTRADILWLTGWPSVSVPQQATALGLKLKIAKEKGEPKRYSA